MIRREPDIVNKRVAMNYARVARCDILFMSGEDSIVAVWLKQNDIDNLSLNRK